MITPKRAAKVMAEGVDENGNPITQVKIRTVLTCRSHMGVCAKCYGSNLATGQAVQLVKQSVSSQHSRLVSLVHSLP